MLNGSSNLLLNKNNFLSTTKILGLLGMNSPRVQPYEKQLDISGELL